MGLASHGQTNLPSLSGKVTGEGVDGSGFTRFTVELPDGKIINIKPGIPSLFVSFDCSHGVSLVPVRLECRRRKHEVRGSAGSLFRIYVDGSPGCGRRTVRIG